MFTSVLIIGANGRLARNLIHALSLHSSQPFIHAFLRNPHALPSHLAKQCNSVQKGDAAFPDHILLALRTTNPTHIIVALGSPTTSSPSNVRTRSANAITYALSIYKKAVNVVVISCMGAGDTVINFGYGRGALLNYNRRHVVRDHQRQEKRFRKFFESHEQRLLIVRPVALTDGTATSGHVQLCTFDGKGRTPHCKLDRHDVAHWIVDHICDNPVYFGSSVNLAKAPKRK